MGEILHTGVWCWWGSITVGRGCVVGGGKLL